MYVFLTGVSEYCVTVQMNKIKTLKIRITLAKQPPGPVMT